MHTYHKDCDPRPRDYRMPAEWEPHDGTWLQWPQDRVYRGYDLKLQGMWLSMVDALHQHEKVHLIGDDERQRDHVAYQLEYFSIGLENVQFYIISTNDVWARDNGPILVVDQGWSHRTWRRHRLCHAASTTGLVGFRRRLWREWSTLV